MTSHFPQSLDSFTKPRAKEDKTNTVSHAALHNAQTDALETIQSHIGTTNLSGTLENRIVTNATNIAGNAQNISQNAQDIQTKQNTLTPGTNIRINNDVIEAVSPISLDYERIINKPKIGGTTVLGNLSPGDVGAVSIDDADTANGYPKLNSDAKLATSKIDYNFAENDAKVQALQGAYVPRGNIAIENPSAAQLTARIVEIMDRQPVLGDVLYDADNNEWYYDDSDNWQNLGGAIVPTASNSTLGLVKGSSDEGKVHVEADGTMTTSAQPVKVCYAYLNSSGTINTDTIVNSRTGAAVALSSLSAGDIIQTPSRQIVDSRDGKGYAVELMPDGHWWMVDNLAYGGSTDVVVSRTTFDGNTSSTATELFGSNTYGDARNNPNFKGYLYNYQAITQAQNAYYGNSYQPTEPVAGIAPSGFHIPTNAEFLALHTAIGSLATGFWQSGDLWNAQYGGKCDASGVLSADSTGYYASSTQIDANTYDGIAITSSAVTTSAVFDKNIGVAVRCIADATPQIFSGKTFIYNGAAFIEQQVRQPRYNYEVTGNSIVLDYNKSNQFELTATGNITLPLPINMPVGAWLSLVYIQDATGSHSMDLATGYQAMAYDLLPEDVAGVATTYMIEKTKTGARIYLGGRGESD